MSDVAVSVIVPVCNVEKFLPECLDSLMAQTLENIEFICINDGSSDNSLKILREYEKRDSRFKIISKENTGYGNTMNVGLRTAQGKYIGIVESDDKALPEMFEELYKVAIENEVDIVKSNFNYYTNGELSFYNNLESLPYHKIIKPRDYPQIFETSMSLWTALYKRDFLIKKSIFFNESPGASYQDVAFTLKGLLAAESVICITEAFLCYRFDNSGSSVYSQKKVFCIIEEFDLVDSFIRENGYESVFPYMMAVKYRHFLEHYDRINILYKYAFLKRMEEELLRDDADGLIDEKRFRDYVWNRIDKILKDSENFFQLDNLQYYDAMEYRPYSLNNSLVKIGFENILHEASKIVVYGAGVYGKQFVSEQDDEIRKKICCFAVTEKSSEMSETVEGIIVREIDELVDWKDDILVVVAIKKNNQLDILKNLKNKGFTKVLSYPVCNL